MKANEAKAKQGPFIEMRAIRGMSLDSISKELEISKSAALAWDKEYREAINTMKEAHIRMLIDTYDLGLAERLKEYRAVSERLRTEVDSRDLTEVQTDKLITLYLEASKRVDTLLERHHLEKLHEKNLPGYGGKVQSIEEFIRSRSTDNPEDRLA